MAVLKSRELGLNSANTLFPTIILWKGKGFVPRTLIHVVGILEKLNIPGTAVKVGSIREECGFAHRTAQVSMNRLLEKKLKKQLLITPREPVSSQPTRKQAKCVVGGGTNWRMERL